MAILLRKLLEQLPPDTEERVRKAKDRWNTRIREALRRETRLSLHRRDEYRDKDEIIAVPINLCPGLPEELRPLDDKIADEHELALLLAPYRQIITALANSTKSATDELLPALSRSKFASLLPRNIGHDISSVGQFAQFLLARLKSFDLTDFVLKVNKDILGVYRYKLWRAVDDPQPKIELYWGVIGLIARDLALEPEQLTCVVLAHELAHGYSHVGADADDQYWTTKAFSVSSPEVVEGLAQYYGWLVCKRLDETLPGTLNSYNALLEKQSGPYRTHVTWMHEFTPEHVRLAMLHTRRDDSPVALDFFTESLNAARNHLPKAERTRVAGGQEY
jgi:hypothetical protein